MSAVTCPPAGRRLPVHGALLLPVAERNGAAEGALCCLLCRRAEKQTPNLTSCEHFSDMALASRNTEITWSRAWEGTITELASVLSSGAVVYQKPLQLCSHCSCRNERKTEQCFHPVPKCQLLGASTGSQGNRPPSGK